MLKLNFKSLKTELIFKLLTWLTIVLLASGLFLGFNASSSFLDEAEKSNFEIKTSLNLAINYWLEGMVQQATIISKNDNIVSMDSDLYVPLINDLVISSQGKYEMLFIADKTGHTVVHYGATTNVGDRDYFKKIFDDNQNVAISNSLISKATGNAVFVIAIAIKENDKTVGLLGMTVDLSVLSQKLGEIKIGNKGYILLTDGNGEMIANPDPDFLGVSDSLKKDEINTGLKEIAQKMLENDSGMFNFRDKKNTEKILVYSKIENTPNWSLAVVVPKSQITNRARNLVLVILATFLIIAIVIIVVIYFSANSIVKPIKETTVLISEVANLKLNTKGNQNLKSLKRKDEVGQIINAVNKMEINLAELISNILKVIEPMTNFSKRLEEMSETQSTNSRELSEKTSIIEDNVQNTSASTQEVNSGVEEVASSAQEVSRNSQQLAEDIDSTNQAIKASEAIINQQKNTMVLVAENNKKTTNIVNEVNDKTNNVQGIVATITAIAEQTNLLALNAAIEAARAGEAGKGFAVVADEIRKLAEESKTSSANIAKILNEITSGSNEVKKAVEQTVESYLELEEGNSQIIVEFEKIDKKSEIIGKDIESLMGLSEEQSASSQEMATAMNTSTQALFQISTEIEEISQRINQQNKFVQELNKTAKALNQLSKVLKTNTDKFKITNEVTKNEK